MEQRPRRGELAEEPRAVTRERRRHEHEQLVDEVGLEERGRECRPALEQERLHSLGRERVELVGERRRRAARARTRPAAGPGRTRAGAAAARRGRRAHRAAGHRPARSPCRPRPRPPRPAARGRAARFLAGHPARAGHRDPAVERDRDLVGDERPSERRPGAPRLVLPPRLEAVVEHGLDAGLAQHARARRPPPDSGRGCPATTRAMPAATIASTHGGVRPWWAHGSIVT